MQDFLQGLLVVALGVFIFTAIVLLEPLDPMNRAALGYDMFSEPVRRAAMQQAAQTGSAVMSGQVTLKQEIGAQ
jgi:CHASE1-domain containing sensor protein